MERLICVRCNKNLAKRSGWKKNGDPKYKTICGSCSMTTEQKQKHNKTQNDKKSDRNKLFVKEYLRTHPCIDCGEDDIIVLEFDHVRGVKFKNIATLVVQRASLDILQKEIDKCEVRCANCHTRVTKKRAGWIDS